MPGRLRALTATMGIILTRARLTVITGLTGSRADCLSAPAPGMAGDAHGAGVVGVVALAAVDLSVDVDSSAAVDSPVAVDLSAVVDSQVDAGSLAAGASREDAGRWAASMAGVGSTVAVEDSTAAAVVASTAAAVDMAAVDTGKGRFERYRFGTETVTAGSKGCQPFLF
jgi:hypothetical protein